MANFLDVVNNVMVLDGIFTGDSDTIANFDNLQHVASIRYAKLAVQSELSDLVSDQLIPYEKTDAVLTVSARTATLASDFVRFEDENPWLVETDAAGVSAGTYIPEYRGGEKRLRQNDLNYRENTGKPSFWYWVGGTTKTVGFYTVPETTYYYRYYYEKDVQVTDESDVVPFVTESEVATFSEACARRFKYLRLTPTAREQIFPQGIENDSNLLAIRRRLGQLLRYKQQPTRYGRRTI